MLNKATWSKSSIVRDPHMAESPERFIDLTEAFRVVRRRRALIALLVLLVISAGVGYLVVTPARYTASSLLLFDTRQIPPFQQQSYPNSVGDSAYVDSQVEILKSDSLARTVISNLNLLHDPEFAPQGTGLLKPVLTIINAVFGSDKTSGELDQWGLAIGIFQENLTIKRIGLTYVIQVGYRSPNASRSAEITNAVTHAYIVGQLASKQQAFQYADIWLQERINTLKTQAQDADRAVAEYKAKNSGLDAGGPLLDERQLTEFSNQRRVALKDLESSSQTYRTLYETFLQRVGEVTQQQSFPATESRVISEASALLVKRDPKILLVLGAASLIGLVFGLGAAFAREHFDTGVRSSRQITKELGIDCLGVLPVIRPTGSGAADRLLQHWLGQAPAGDRVISSSVRRPRIVVGEPFSRFAETIRSVKVAADIAGLRRPNKVIGITSARTHEGKSVVAANLSEMIALSGCKALLIDCNLRNVALTRQLAPGATAGLMDVVACQIALNEVLWVDPTTSIEFLPAVDSSASHPKRNEKLLPATLWQRSQLTSAGLQSLFESIEDRYDYVILDLPPLAIADVQAISHLVSSFVLVIECGTPQQAVIDALSASDFLFEKLLGALLNKANPSELRKFDS
jgi:uncharacterized protein involved in exopolysaccharide biosynthesis/Mrp family chromosome partitioning ATPase